MIFPHAVRGSIQQNGSKTETIHYGIIPNYAGTASAVYGLPNFHSMLSSSFFRLQQLRRAETTFSLSNSARNDAVLGLLCLGDSPRAKSKKAVKFTGQVHETVLPSRNKVQADAIEGFGALKRPFPQKPDLSTSQTLSVSRRPKALSTPCDPGNVNGLHRFVRSELLELFEPSQATGSKQLRNSRVGLRCVYCAQANRKGKNVATTYSFFPKSLEDIYVGVCTWQRLHFAHCNNVPKTKSEKYLRLKEDRRRGKKAYWADSANEIGLRNVSHKREGIMWCQENSKDT